MLIIFICIWGVLGLGVFVVAMGGGPRGARKALHSESNAGNRLITLGVVVLFVFGLAVPAFVMADNGTDKASVGPGGVHLDAAEQKGRELFAKTCAVCHTLGAVKSVARTGPNLDVRVGEELSSYKDRRSLVLNAIELGRAEGRGNMPALLYQGKEAEDVADFVAAVAGH